MYLPLQGSRCPAPNAQTTHTEKFPNFLNTPKLYNSMKLLLESWKHYLNESLPDRQNFVCEPNKTGFKQYYSIDNNNPPLLEDILKCWRDNDNAIYDSSVSRNKPAFYPVDEITPYREYTKEQLRNSKEEFEDLKNKIAKDGIKEPIIIIFGKNGRMKVGEGNHRHQAALELGLEKIPVRFLFYQYVNVPQSKNPL